MFSWNCWQREADMYTNHTMWKYPHKIKVEHKVCGNFQKETIYSVAGDSLICSTNIYWALTISHTFFPSLHCARQNLGNRGKQGRQGTCIHRVFISRKRHTINTQRYSHFRAFSSALSPAMRTFILLQDWLLIITQVSALMSPLQEDSFSDHYI